MALPPLTPQQRADALQKAAIARKERAEVKNRLKRGAVTLSEVIKDGSTDDVIGKMKVSALLESLPGVGKVRAKQIMEKLGYGPDKHLAVTVSTSNLAPYRDPAVILIDQLKQIYMDGVLEPLDTTQWYPKLMRKDYAVGLNITETAVDDPDPAFYENYVCGAMRNYTGYCNPELEQLFDRQSTEADEGQRKKLVWEIERKLAEDGARPIIFYNRFAYCWQPQVKGWTMMVNSIINNFRMEDVWLDK